MKSKKTRRFDAIDEAVLCVAIGMGLGLVVGTVFFTMGMSQSVVLLILIGGAASGVIAGLGRLALQWRQSTNPISPR